MTERTRRCLLAFGACCLYGGWAFVANRPYGVAAACRALFTQGSISFASTFVLTLLMDTLFHRSTRPAMQVGLAITGACLTMVVGNVGLHWLLGTPALLATITPVLVLGAWYCSLYSVGLWHQQRRRQTTEASPAVQKSSHAGG